MEVFGGGGSVLLNKERSVREILNDANGNLINLYQVVREHPDELKDRLLYVLHSREDFQIAQHRLALDAYKDDIQRAADFFQVVKQSYAGNGKQFCSVARSMWASFPSSTGWQAGFKGSLWKMMISELSSKGTTPPTRSSTSTRPTFSPRITTPDTFSCGKTTRGWQRLCWAWKANSSCPITCAPEVLELYQQPGILIEEVDRINNMAQRYESGAVYREVLISNYDTTRTTPEQLFLFEAPQQKERKILWNGLI